MRSETFIRQDKALHADMLAAMAEGRAEILFDSEDTLLLRENICGVHFLTSRNAAEAEALLCRLFRESADTVLHGELPFRVAERIGFQIDPPCVQVMYEGALLPVSRELDIRRPKNADFPVVCANYSLIGGDALRRDFDRPDFLCGYLDGKPVCFVGLHSEGSMGLLTVLPEYRRRGFARQIYCTLINNQLQKHRLPYAQIYTDNENSLNLQKSLGFSFSCEPIRWSWNPGDAQG